MPNGRGPSRSRIEISELDCGIRLVTESMPGVSSASLGFWVGTGSRDESPEQSGISHFLEHLLFKGTPVRSARSIAEEIDGVGGDMNAFTTKEYTTFYVRTLGSDLALGLEILSDIMLDPAFRPFEVDAERQVILEEVLMHRDEPADVVQERFAETFFGPHPLGREVLGSPEVISEVAVPSIRSFFEEHYRPANIVASAAGAVDHDVLAAEFEARFKTQARGAPPVRSAPAPPVPAVDVLARETEQAHLVLGVPAPSRRSEQRFALALLNHILGGGLSSRLFQKVREERGLCYSIISDRVAYADAGALVVSVGTAPERAKEVLRLIVSELEELAGNGPSTRELELAKRHLIADTVLSLEESGSRMSRVGSSLLLHGEVLSVEELASKVDAVSEAELHALSHDILTGPRVLAVVGPFAASEFDDVIS